MKKCGFNFDTSYTALPEYFYSASTPETAPAPNIIIVNSQLAESLGLTLSNLADKELAELFSGNQLTEGSNPFSQAYAGHQFGHFTILGDGRAHLLGEHITPEGNRVDIQFKGSGRTPYSRRGDGKAVLGPMLREYIISEALHHLGIPTTRSLAVATTGESVRRETVQTGAILTRVASSHIRVGTFEFAAYRQEDDAVQALMEYTIQRHYPELAESKNKAVALLKKVMEAQADLITHWMRVGFIHGVMNTDNMALSGEAIDFGPCAFMDAYNPRTVFSSIDETGRYAYTNQPGIAQWNIARFAETLLPLIDEDTDKAIKIAEETINQFANIYRPKWQAMMNSKLGLQGTDPGDDKLISDLLEWMHKNRADYTNTFCDLSRMEKPTGQLYSQSSFEQWYLRWQDRLKKNEEPLDAAISLMQTVNPTVIPRNHRVEEALEAANRNDLAPLQQLLEVLAEPYKNDPLIAPYQAPPDESKRVYKTFCGT